MQAKPDFISVKVLTFIFIKCGFPGDPLNPLCIPRCNLLSFYFKIEHIIYILEEKLPMIMERRL